MYIYIWLKRNILQEENGGQKGFGFSIWMGIFFLLSLQHTNCVVGSSLCVLETAFL